MGNVPEYVKYSINSVLSVDTDASVYFCTDQNITFRGCTMIDIREFETDEINSVSYTHLTLPTKRIV